MTPRGSVVRSERQNVMPQAEGKGKPRIFAKKTAFPSFRVDWLTEDGKGSSAHTGWKGKGRRRSLGGNASRGFPRDKGCLMRYAESAAGPGGGRYMAHNMYIMLHVRGTCIRQCQRRHSHGQQYITSEAWKKAIDKEDPGEGGSSVMGPGFSCSSLQHNKRAKPVASISLTLAISKARVPPKTKGGPLGCSGRCRPEPLDALPQLDEANRAHNSESSAVLGRGGEGR